MAIQDFDPPKLFTICKCGCLVSYLKEDVDRHYYMNDEEGYLWYTIVCPRCNRRLLAEEYKGD